MPGLSEIGWLKSRVIETRLSRRGNVDILEDLSLDECTYFALMGVCHVDAAWSRGRSSREQPRSGVAVDSSDETGGHDGRVQPCFSSLQVRAVDRN